MSEERFNKRMAFERRRDAEAEQWTQRQPPIRQQGDYDARMERATGFERSYPQHIYDEEPEPRAREMGPQPGHSGHHGDFGARRDDMYGNLDRRAGYGGYYRERDDYRSGAKRPLMDRAADEVASWFGNDAAEARREADHRGKGPKGYVRSDARILEDVNDRLHDDRWVDASDIEVKVDAAEITLSGTVRSKEEKRRAEDCADAVSGVRHVQNNLRVDNAVVGGGSTLI